MIPHILVSFVAPSSATPHRTPVCRGFSRSGLLPNETGDASTELLGLLGALRLGEHADERLGAGGPHEHASAAVELGVEPLDLAATVSGTTGGSSGTFCFACA